MKSMVQGFQDAGKELGVKEVIIGNSSNDQVKETELINTYVSQGVKGIAIAPLSPTVSIEALKQANEQGVAVALTNSGGFTDIDFIVGGYMSDNTANGMIVGDAAVQYIEDNMLTGTIKVGIIDYDHQKPEESSLRYGGFEEALKAAGVEYEVVAHQSAELQDTALTATSDMITANPEIQVIFACNEGGTIGAAQAVKQAGLSDLVGVFGYDGSDQITSMIIDGSLQAAVAQDPYGQGVAAMTDLINYLMGNPGEFSRQADHRSGNLCSPLPIRQLSTPGVSTTVWRSSTSRWKRNLWLHQDRWRLPISSSPVWFSRMTSS